jgi:hypothetical protein
VVSARSGEDLTTLSRRTGNVWSLAETAVYNRVFSNHIFGGRELVKIARVEPVGVLPKPPHEDIALD